MMTSTMTSVSPSACITFFIDSRMKMELSMLTDSSTPLGSVAWMRGSSAFTRFATSSTLAVDCGTTGMNMPGRPPGAREAAGVVGGQLHGCDLAESHQVAVGAARHHVVLEVVDGGHRRGRAQRELALLRLDASAGSSTFSARRALSMSLTATRRAAMAERSSQMRIA